MLFMTQCFCQAVGRHFRCGDILDPNNLVLDGFSNEMMTDVNVFRASVRYGVLSKSDRALVVGIKVRWGGVRRLTVAAEFREEGSDPLQLFCGFRESHILSFHCR